MFGGGGIWNEEVEMTETSRNWKMMDVYFV